MKVGDIRNKGIAVSIIVIVAVIVTAIVVGAGVYMVVPRETAAPVTPGVVTKGDVESWIKTATGQDVKDVLEGVSPDIIASVSTKTRHIDLGIAHFTTKEGSMWCQSHYLSLANLVNRFPWLSIIEAESVATEDINTVAEDMIKNKGAEIFVADSEFIGLPLVEIADKYPDKYLGMVFESHSDLIGTKPNLFFYYCRSYQARYLAGLVMGALTKTNKIGVVCSYPIPVVMYRLAGLAAGVREVNPDAKIYIGSFVGSWYDPPTESEIARRLVEEYGVDVLHNPATDSLAPLQVATEKGIWFVGKDSDVVATGAGPIDTVATSYRNFWEYIYYRILCDYLAGVKPDPFYWPGFESAYIDENGVKWYPQDIVNNGVRGAAGISPKAKAAMGEELVNLVETRRNQMIRGAFDPLLGFEFKNAETGVVEKPAGAMPSPDYLLTLDYYVEPVVPPE